MNQNPLTAFIMAIVNFVNVFKNGTTSQRVGSVCTLVSLAAGVVLWFMSMVQGPIIPPAAPTPVQDAPEVAPVPVQPAPDVLPSDAGSEAPQPPLYLGLLGFLAFPMRRRSSFLAAMAGAVALSCAGCAGWYQALTPTEKLAVDQSQVCGAALFGAAVPCVVTCIRTPGADCEVVCVAELAGNAGATCGEAYGSLHSDALASAIRRAVGVALDLYGALLPKPVPSGPAGGSGL